MKFIALLLSLFLLNGCATCRYYYDLKPNLPDKEAKNKNYSVLDTFLSTTFTPEVYEKIKNIPLVDGPHITPYVSGVNCWSNMLSFITFNGVGRKVILKKERLKKVGVKALIHEYIHHVDDLTRDGEGNFIDLLEFKIAYIQMSQDTKWAGLTIYAEKMADDFWTETFGIGPMSEHIAYTVSHVYLYGGPDYMKRVFRRVFNKYKDMK